MALSLMFPHHPLAHHLAFPACSSPRASYQHPLRIAEDDASYQLTARVPGAAAEGVKASVSDDGTLKLTAKDTQGKPVLHKTLHMPQDADPTSVQCWCADGILKVSLSKLQPPEPTTVAVLAEQAPALDPEQEYEVFRNLPGISAEEAAVEICEGILSISAESTRGHGTYHYRLSLPEDALVQRAAAFCQHGILTVRLPKRRAAAPTEIPVASSEAEVAEDTTRLLRLSVPGYGAEHISITCRPQRVVIRLEKDGQSLERHVPLPDGLDPNALHAVCSNGLLTVGYAESGLRQPTEMEVEVVSGSSEPVAAPAAAAEQ